MPDFSPSKWLQSNNHLFYLSHPSPVLFVAVSQRPSYPHLFLPPPSPLPSSFHLLSTPYTSTHHPSSSLFCCYIIATITSTSIMQSLFSYLLTFSLSPQALSVSPTLPRPVCRCITATILSPPLPPSSFSYHFLLTFPLPSPVLFVAVPQRPSYLPLSLLPPSRLPPISLHPCPQQGSKKSRTDFTVYPGL